MWCVFLESCLSTVFIINFIFFHSLKLRVIFQIFHQNNFLVLLKKFLVVMLLILNGLSYYTMLRGVFQSPDTVLETNESFRIFSEEFQVPSELQEIYHLSLEYISLNLSICFKIFSSVISIHGTILSF